MGGPDTSWKLVEWRTRIVNSFGGYSRDEDWFKQFGKIETLGDIAQKTEGQLLRMPNLGRKSIREIKETLSMYGLRLGMTENEVKALSLLPWFEFSL